MRTSPQCRHECCLAQDAEQLIGALRAHVEREFAALGSSNSAGVRVKSVGDWWEADPDSKLFKMAERALTREWGRQPLFVREGGTMPVRPLLQPLCMRVTCTAAYRHAFPGPARHLHLACPTIWPNSIILRSVKGPPRNKKLQGHPPLNCTSHVASSRRASTLM